MAQPEEACQLGLQIMTRIDELLDKAGILCPIRYYTVGGNAYMDAVQE